MILGRAAAPGWRNCPGEYQAPAENELREERQQLGGWSDILKALFMYVETPEERVLQKPASEPVKRRPASARC